jgi:tetratricopeptide (TPR) repeat protein
LHQFDNTRKIMAKDSSEIAKLTERISKDPKSKLFVPLAEEYKKMGDIEMAIHVLSEGLKVNPGYVTARSFLGRLLLEQGNFAEAQKEFEEVVKAIPDNLLAQRKLGDLHLLQNRQKEALDHYKIALALNPRDAEIASLISDLEAGGDAGTAFVEQPGLPTAPEQALSSPPQPTQKSAGISSPLPSSSSAPAAPSEPVTEVSQIHIPDAAPQQEKNEPVVEQPVVALPDESTKSNEQLQDAAQESAELAVEEEEAEEIFEIESLDENAPLPAPESSNIDFFSENVFGTAPVEEQDDTVAAPSSSFFEEPASAEVKAEESSIFDSNAVMGEVVEPTQPEEEQTLGQPETDDFTTDTLAELYIAQGFFEKAIDIYQRMLADNPNSRGLKDKLERVKAMAMHESEEEGSPAAEAKTAPESTEETELFSEAKEYVPPAEIHEEEITIDAELFEPQKDAAESREPEKLETDIFTEPKEYRPENKPEEWSGPDAEETSADEAFESSVSKKARPIPQYADFEPREYIPPSGKQQPAQQEITRPASKSAAAANKATIERLEHWLSNIKKER